MNSIEQAFHDTLEDVILSRRERRELRATLAGQKLSPRELGVYRSKIFDMARDTLASQPDMAPAQVLDWLEEANKLLLPDPDPGFENRCYFSPGEECLAAIRSHLRKAIKAVDVCVFTISDDRISSEIRACHERGLRVRIITDNDKMYDMGSDVEDLAEAGIEVCIDRTDKHMHHKFALIDEAWLLLGSYNWTRSAATRNEESLLVTNDAQSLRAFGREFEKLWERMAPFRGN